LESIGKENGNYSISQTSLAWLMAKPTITSPIIGPRTIEQLNDNLGSIDFKLSPDEIQILDEASKWKPEKDE
jgi:aryl-alcohol dehydrogenase-like predicted oxidoreductase